MHITKKSVLIELQQRPWWWQQRGRSINTWLVNTEGILISLAVFCWHMTWSEVCTQSVLTAALLKAGLSNVQVNILEVGYPEEAPLISFLHRQINIPMFSFVDFVNDVKLSTDRPFWSILHASVVVISLQTGQIEVGGFDAASYSVPAWQHIAEALKPRWVTFVYCKLCWSQFFSLFIFIQAKF